MKSDSETLIESAHAPLGQPATAQDDGPAVVSDTLPAVASEAPPIAAGHPRYEFIYRDGTYALEDRLEGEDMNAFRARMVARGSGSRRLTAEDIQARGIPRSYFTLMQPDHEAYTAEPVLDDAEGRLIENFFYSGVQDPDALNKLRGLFLEAYETRKAYFKEHGTKPTPA